MRAVLSVAMHVIALIIVSAQTCATAGDGVPAPDKAKGAGHTLSGGFIEVILQMAFRDAIEKLFDPREKAFFEQVIERIPGKGKDWEGFYDDFARWLAGDLVREGAAPPTIVTNLLVFSGPYPKESDIGLVDAHFDQPKGDARHAFQGGFRVRTHGMTPTATILATIAIAGDQSEDAMLVSVVKHYQYVAGKWRCIDSTSKTVH
jgi:hypothetical protein